MKKNRIGYFLLICFLIHSMSIFAQKKAGNRFINAIKNNKTQIIESLIKKGFDIKQPPENISSYLALAIDYESFDAAVVLIENDVDIDCKVGLLSQSPMEWALHNANIEVLDALTDKYGYSSFTFHFDYSILVEAARRNKLKVVKHLIENEKGIDVNKKGSNNTSALYFAASNNNVEMADLLLKNGAEINATDNEGYTPLHCAASKGNDEIVSFLLSKGADMNTRKIFQGGTPLHAAALNDSISTLLIFLENGADIQITDDYGKTLLHYAAMGNKKQVCEFLLKNGFDVNIKDKEWITPLHLAAQRNGFETAAFLIKKGADVNAVDFNFATPLTYAVFERQKEMVLLLLKHNAVIFYDFPEKSNLFLQMVEYENSLEFIKIAYLYDPDLTFKNLDGKTALEIAKAQGKVLLSNFLQNPYKAMVYIELGLFNKALEHIKSNLQEIEIKDENGKNILHHAVKSNNEELVRYLCENNKELINEKDNNGQSPLFEALFAKYYNMGNLLIENQANPYQPDKQGYNCLYFAENSNDEKWLKIFAKSKFTVRKAKIKPRLKLSENPNTVSSVTCSPDGHYILTGHNYGHIILWDIRSGKQIRTLFGYPTPVKAICFSPACDTGICYALSGSYEARLWNVFTGTKDHTFKGHTDWWVPAVGFSPDGKIAITGGIDGAIKLWDVNSGALIKTINAHKYGINAVCFSPVCQNDTKGGKYILSGSDDNTVKLWETSTGKNVWSNKAWLGRANSVCFSPDGKSALIGWSGGLIEMINLGDGSKIKSFNGHTAKILTVCYSPDGKTAVSSSEDALLKIWDLATGECIHTLAGHSKGVRNAFYHPSGKYIFSAANEQSVIIWSTKTGKQLVRILPMNNNDYIILTPDRYYFTTKTNLDNMSWIVGSQTYNFDQFDLKFNRPDIILSRLPEGDTALIPLYYKAYQKRLKKMNMTEEMLRSDFHVPEIKIVKTEKLKTKNEELIKIKIEANDTKYKLDRINVWVNNVPVYGMNGIDLRQVKNYDGHSLRRNLEIPLSNGENKIEISVLNQAGAESLKSIVHAAKERTDEKPDLYIVSIGASEYEIADFNLNYAAKDANDIVALLNSNSKKQYKNIFIKKLTDKNVVIDSIKAIKNILKNTKVDDNVIVFYAGHGILDEKLDYYLATHDIDFNNPSKRGLAYEELENLLDSIPARKKLMLIDACHSGEVDEEEELLLVETSKKHGKVRFRSVDSKRGFKKINRISYKNSFELMKELFADLRRGTGAVVISSAGGGEFAYEGEDWNNGVFTYSLLNGLKSQNADLDKSGEITVSELKNYVFDKVRKLTGGRQNPTSRRENLEFDFRVW